MDLTLNQLAYEIYETIRGNVTDDDPIDIRFIKEIIIQQRALWQRNELNKNRTIDPNLIQNLGCVQLENIDASACADLCNSISTGCKLKRTVLEIPQTIERHNDTTITRVAPINIMKTPFYFVNYNRAIFANSGRFTKDIIIAFLWQKRIYIKSNRENIDWKLLRHINIQGVFEDPTAAGAFTNCDGTTCYTDDQKFPINRWMWTYMKEQVLRTMGIKSTAPSDNNNDDSGNQPQVQQPTK